MSLARRRVHYAGRRLAQAVPSLVPGRRDDVKIQPAVIDVRDLEKHSRHPYTRELLDAVPGKEWDIPDFGHAAGAADD